MRRGLLLVFLVATSTAWAAPDRRIVVDAPAQPPDQHISNVLYLERCVGNCIIMRGTSTDARENRSTIPNPATSTISEFSGALGNPAAPETDAEWNAVVECVKQVYSPYNVLVTDERPASGSYHMAILAGVPGEIGLANDILGISPLSSNCSPIENAISFSFANHHSRTDEQRVFNLCWTVAQESAHAFGLDHTYMFEDGRSTCNDPMTYRVDCGGQRFFRNFRATCGETSPRACRCGATQNSHQKLLDVFGPGTPITPAPTMTLTLPQNGVALAAVAGGRAGSQRGVAKVELWLNGSKWGEVPGEPYGVNGQPADAVYTIPIPGNVPAPSKYDVVARACDDIGTCTDSIPIASYKGSIDGCTSSDQCAEDQSCEDGYCRWPEAAGEVGDECNYPQFCKSNLCLGSEDLTICTQPCSTTADDCPGDLRCSPTSGTIGVCFVEDTGGCCSAGHSPMGPWVYIGFSLMLFVVITRRPRRRERG